MGFQIDVIGIFSDYLRYELMKLLANVLVGDVHIMMIQKIDKRNDSLRFFRLASPRQITESGHILKLFIKIKKDFKFVFYNNFRFDSI